MRHACITLAGLVTLASAGCAPPLSYEGPEGFSGGLVATVSPAPNAPGSNSPLARVAAAGPLQSTSQALIRFDHLFGEGSEQIPPNSEIIEARLWLLATEHGTGGARLHRMLIPFNRQTTWDSLKDGVQTDDREAAATPAAVFPPISPGWVSVDVTASVAAWAGGAVNHGWTLIAAPGDPWGFATFNAEPALRPVVQVLYEVDVPLLTVGAGDADQTTAVLWAASDEAGSLTLELSGDPAFADARVFELEVENPLQPAKTRLGGLTPGTQYHVRVTNGAGQMTARFRTPAAPDKRRGLRFGVSGDWRGELTPYPSIRNAPRRSLDFFVALGDTIYADVPSPAVPLAQARTITQFRRKYRETLAPMHGLRSLAALRESTVLYAMIDDHEVANDFAGAAKISSDARFRPAPPDAQPLDDDVLISASPLYARGLQAFFEWHPLIEEFYPRIPDDPRFTNRPRLYRYRTFGADAALFLVDARSFRDESLPDVRPDSLSRLATFFVDAFRPDRTMLGQTQLAQLKSDLLKARDGGMTWKFICIPEPTQNLGPVLGGDRFEGYAAERSELLSFIQAEGIENVVFIAADIHGTIVNNLTYQAAPDGPQVTTGMWETTTGPVAYDAPFGPTTVTIGSSVPLLGEALSGLYDSRDRRGKNIFVRDAINLLLRIWGYSPIGLTDAPLMFDRLAGEFTAVHNYGWTEFEIDAETRALTVTTWGIPWYSEMKLAFDPLEVTNRRPRVINQYRVTPR